MLDEIKKQIEVLDPSYWIDQRDEHGQRFSRLLPDDLKALCASHTALEAQVAEMKELLDVATEIQIGASYFMKHHPELGWRVYCGSVSIGGVSVTEYLASPLEAFKAVKERPSEKLPPAEYVETLP